MLRAGPKGLQRIVPSSAASRPQPPPKAAPQAAGPAVISSRDVGGRAAAGGAPDTQHTPQTAPPTAPQTAALAAAKVRAAPKARIPASVRPQAHLPARDDSVLETDDWVKSFEEKWNAAMAIDATDPDEEAEEKAEEPPPKRVRVGVPAEAPTAPTPKQAPAPRPQAQLAPKAPAGPPPMKRKPAEDAPLTPGAIAAPPAQSEASIREEHPDWATRCTIEPAKPGQPQRITLSMAEVGFGDAEVTEWCQWMDRRLTAERPFSKALNSGRTRFKASTVDFSENKISANGAKALCLLLEKQAVRTEMFRLTGNGIGNEGLRCISKYLMCSSQPPTLELHLSRNRITSEGVKWLLGSLAVHPAYPWWNSETDRFVPLWLRLENAKLKGDVGYKALDGACQVLHCSACIGDNSGEFTCNPRQCVNVGCCDEQKHNCVAHLCNWEAPEDAEPLPAPAAHARLMFAAAGRGARKAPPSGVEEPKRDEPRLIYEDDELAVVMKPPGWSCAANPKDVDPAWARLKPLARRKQVGDLLAQDAVPALQAWLLLRFGADPNCDASRDQASDRGLAHRLDMDTSGPILIGKTLKGYEHARKQIVVGLLKDYLALVHGSLSTDRGECLSQIDTSPFAETRRVRVDPNGQPATTVWEAIAEYESPDRKERYTLVHCRMVTLRTHQLRVHFQHLGHPVVGDSLYGTGDPPNFCPRIFLHKVRIGFFNVQGQACIEACSLQTAPDLWKALGRLRKVGGMAMMGCGAPGL